MVTRKKTPAQKNQARRDAAEVAKLPALRAACAFEKARTIRHMEERAVEYRYRPELARLHADLLARIARLKRERMPAFRGVAISSAMADIQTTPAFYLKRAANAPMADMLLDVMTFRVYRPLLR
jgi:hypothetical protein